MCLVQDILETEPEAKFKVSIAWEVQCQGGEDEKEKGKERQQYGAI